MTPNMYWLGLTKIILIIFALPAILQTQFAEGKPQPEDNCNFKKGEKCAIDHIRLIRSLVPSSTSLPTTELEATSTSLPTTKLETTSTSLPTTKLETTSTSLPTTELEATSTSLPTTELETTSTSLPTTELITTTEAQRSKPCCKWDVQPPPWFIPPCTHCAKPRRKPGYVQPPPWFKEPTRRRG